MDLPVMPPVSPMLAKPVSKLPPGMHYEGKWDGFRAVIFRDGDEVEIGSRNERPLTRYFPEVVSLAREYLPERCVVDGELIIDTRGHLDFDALLSRIHPAASRVELLSHEHPASVVAFDLLALGDESLVSRPFEQRRELLAGAIPQAPRVHLAPGTRDVDLAMRWFDQFEGAGLDGLIAKPLTGTYEYGKRTMFKLKHERTADCVVAGFRWHKSGRIIGSLLLGLYDDAGRLHQIGVSASFTQAKRTELVGLLESLIMDDPSQHPWNYSDAQPGQRLPGGQTRWNADKDLSWVPLQPVLVAEVAYDHLQSGRFRHTAKFRRWRPDRDPSSCTYAQLELPSDMTLVDVFEAGG